MKTLFNHSVTPLFQAKPNQRAVLATPNIQEPVDTFSKRRPFFQLSQQPIQFSGDILKKNISQKNIDPVIQASFEDMLENIYQDEYKIRQHIRDTEIEEFKIMLALIPEDSDLRKSVALINPSLSDELLNYQEMHYGDYSDKPLNQLNNVERTQCIESIYKEACQSKIAFLFLASTFILNLTQQQNILPKGQVPMQSPFK